MLKCEHGHTVKLPVIVLTITRPIVCWQCLLGKGEVMAAKTLTQAQILARIYSGDKPTALSLALVAAKEKAVSKT